MMQIFDKIWEEYFFEECTRIETSEEKEIIRKTAELHEKVDALLTKEESEAMQEYVDCIYDSAETFYKKAFMKGVRLAISLFLEAYKGS